MGFKDLSYTKKGTLIGGIVGFLIGWGFWVLFGVCNGFVQSQRCGFIESVISLGNILSGIIGLISGIILGAIIGYIYRKIKLRKQSNLQI